MSPLATVILPRVEALTPPAQNRATAMQSTAEPLRWDLNGDRQLTVTMGPHSNPVADEFATQMTTTPHPLLVPKKWKTVQVLASQEVRLQQVLYIVINKFSFYYSPRAFFFANVCASSSQRMRLCYSATFCSATCM